MTVLLVLFTCITFLAVDYFRTSRARMYEVPRGAYITPGFECLGALCNDGGEKVELDYEI
jgi:hypothetical protein